MPLQIEEIQLKAGNKVAISLRIDPEVLTWFRRKYPQGYQTAMGLALKNYMVAIKQQECDR